MPGLHFQYVTPNIDGMYLDLTVRRLGSVFLIQYTRDSILAPVLFDAYLKLSNDYDEFGDPSVTERLIKPFETYIERFPSTDQGYLLSEYLYPRYFVLEGTAGPEDTEITPRLKESKELLPGDYLHRQPELTELTDWDRNIYSSRQVCLPLPQSGIPD